MSADTTTASGGFLLWRATNAWQRAQRAALQPFNLTHVQYALLSSLSGADRRGMTQSEAATHSGVDPMTTSQVLRLLEGRELVTRQPHPDDRRAHRVVITTNGRNLVRKAQPKVDKADAEFFASAGADRSRFFGVLSRLG
jgi:MarR family transcriptional regulator, organic hydroperoxide resistance regulator